MTLSSCLNKNDQVPSRKLPKTLDTIAFMVYTMTHARPVKHPNTRLFTKYNGEATLLKGLKT